jgi:hypothetical protein
MKLGRDIRPRPFGFWAAQRARLALADPARRAAYAVQTQQQHRPLIAVAIRDCYQKQNAEMLKAEAGVYPRMNANGMNSICRKKAQAA